MQKCMIKISQIKKNAFNESIYDQNRDLEPLIDSMNECGLIHDIVIDDDNTVISGHRRVAAAIALGWTHISFKRLKKKTKDAKLVVNANVQRVKSALEIFNELMILEEKHPSCQGSRRDIKGTSTGFDRGVTRQVKIAKEAGLKPNKVQKILKIGKFDKNLLALIGDKVSLDQIDKLVTTKEKRAKANEKIEADLPSARSDSPDFKPEIYNKSSLVLSEIPSKSVQAVICSPPYWDQRFYDNANELGRESTVKAYLQNLSQFFYEVFRVLKDDGSLFIVIADSFDDLCLQRIPSKLSDILIDDIHFILRNEIIWRKTTSLYKGNDSNFTTETEKILYYVKGRNYKKHPVLVPCKTQPKEVDDEIDEIEVMSHQNTDGTTRIGSLIDKFKTEKNMRDYWDPEEIAKACFEQGDKIININDLLTEGGDPDVILAPACHQKSKYLPEGTHHAAPYDVLIPAILIEKSTDEGDTVLDIFCGSGTTGEAAIKLGRKFIGYEIDSKSANMTEYRLLKCYQDTMKKQQEKENPVPSIDLFQEQKKAA